MRKITHRAFSLLLLAALIVAGLALYTIRYVDDGRDWALSFARANSGSSGLLTDRSGRLLASFDAVENRYAEDAATRTACYAVTGDYWGRSGTGALTCFWDDMHSYSLLTGTTHSNSVDLQLTVDAALCRTAYEALAGRKSLICSIPTAVPLSSIILLIATVKYPLPNPTSKAFPPGFK